eukprot:6177734-Pleurochrysis_carterae.AAC.3
MPFLASSPGGCVERALARLGTTYRGTHVVQYSRTSIVRSSPPTLRHPTGSPRRLRARRRRPLRLLVEATALFQREWSSGSQGWMRSVTSNLIRLGCQICDLAPCGDEAKLWGRKGRVCAVGALTSPSSLSVIAPRCLCLGGGFSTTEQPCRLTASSYHARAILQAKLRPIWSIMSDPVLMVVVVGCKKEELPWPCTKYHLAAVEHGCASTNGQGTRAPGSSKRQALSHSLYLDAVLWCRESSCSKCCDIVIDHGNPCVACWHAISFEGLVRAIVADSIGIQVPMSMCDKYAIQSYSSSVFPERTCRCLAYNSRSGFSMKEAMKLLT